MSHGPTAVASKVKRVFPCWYLPHASPGCYTAAFFIVRAKVPLLIILVGILAALAGMVVDYTSSWARIWRIDQTATHSDL